MTKTCTKCNIEKEIDCFINKRNICKCCKAAWNKIYYKVNAVKLAENRKEYKKDNTVKIAEYFKEYYKANTIKIAENQKKYKKQYYKANTVKVAEKQKIYYKANTVKISDNRKTYYKANTDKIAKKHNEYIKTRYKNDPTFRLRHNVSVSISKYLKKNNSSKNNQSCLQHLPYTIEELKIHLESLFESWMNWENQGLYKASDWNDNDHTTWKWQIDHIIPHSIFNYTSMDSEEFKACWSLDNLRPYSAKQNQLDGTNRIRH